MKTFSLFILLGFSATAVAQPRAQVNCNAFNNNKPIIVNNPLDYWLTGSGVQVGTLYYAQSKQIGRLPFAFRGIRKPKVKIEFFAPFTFDLQLSEEQIDTEGLGSSRFETKIGTSVTFGVGWDNVANADQVKAEFKRKVKSDIALYTTENTDNKIVKNIDSLLNSQIPGLQGVAQRIDNVKRTFQYLVVVNEVIVTDTLGFETGDIRTNSGSADALDVLNVSVNYDYSCNALTSLQARNGKQRNILYTVTYFDLEKLRNGVIALAVEYRPNEILFAPDVPEGFAYTDDFEIRGDN